MKPDTAARVLLTPWIDPSLIEDSAICFELLEPHLRAHGPGLQAHDVAGTVRDAIRHELVRIDG